MSKFTETQRAALSELANATQTALQLATYLENTQRAALTDVQMVAKELARAASALEQLREKGGR